MELLDIEEHSSIGELSKIDRKTLLNYCRQNDIQCYLRIKNITYVNEDAVILLLFSLFVH
jgi:hypothetical protein